jgi:cytoskeletal protein RodZ
MFEIGTSLREARLRQALDFPELEQSTKIRGKYLRALEDERFDVLPSHTYVKGFLRTYAEQLGLDGQLYVDEYNSRYVAADDEGVQRARRSPAAARRRHRQQRRESNVVLVAVTAIGILTALVIAAWRFGDPGQEQVRGLESATTETGRRTVAARTPLLLVTALNGSTRLEVRRNGPTGASVYSGTLDEGQTQRFDGKQLFVRLGRPASVTVAIDGRSQALPPRWATYLVSHDGLRRYRSP